MLLEHCWTAVEIATQVAGKIQSPGRVGSLQPWVKLFNHVYFQSDDCLSVVIWLEMTQIPCPQPRTGLVLNQVDP